MLLERADPLRSGLEFVRPLYGGPGVFDELLATRCEHHQSQGEKEQVHPVALFTRPLEKAMPPVIPTR
jgi:hypothetical protein